MRELESRGLTLSRGRSIGPLAQASFIFANCLITASTYNVVFDILTGPKGLVTKELETRGLRLSRSRSISPLAQASFIFANYLITASTYNIVFGILTGRAPAVYSILGHEYIWQQTKHSYPRPGARMMSFWRERAVTAAFRPGNETAFSFLAALSLSFRTFLWCLQLLVLQ